MSRSQPPVFPMIVQDYVAATGDTDFMTSLLPEIEQEVNFWIKNRSRQLNIGVDVRMVFHYKAKSNTPRPESYKEDLETVKGLNTSRALHI